MMRAKDRKEYMKTAYVVISLLVGLIAGLALPMVLVTIAALLFVGISVLRSEILYLGRALKITEEHMLLGRDHKTILKSYFAGLFQGAIYANLGWNGLMIQFVVAFLILAIKLWANIALFRSLHRDEKGRSI